jgi:hypothetical protein
MLFISARRRQKKFEALIKKPSHVYKLFMTAKILFPKTIDSKKI